MAVRLGPVGPGPNALEGAAAALCAVAAMAAVSALALVLLGAGSVGSLWPLTMAVTAMAVGGSVRAEATGSGAAGSTDSGLGALFGGGGGLGPSLSGAVQVVPLGVTLVGAVVLWLAFARRPRSRRLDAGEWAARAAGACAAGVLALAVVAALGRGEITVPDSATSGPGDALGGLGGPGGLGGGGMADLATRYEAQVGTTALGALPWVVVTLAVGCAIGRRLRFPLGGTPDRLRDAWAPSVSAVVRTLLVLAWVPTMLLATVGTAVGGRAGTAAGAVLLLAPNALAVLLTLGAGAPWTAAAHPVESAEGSPLASLLGGTGATGGTGGLLGAGALPDAAEDLRSLAVGGVPLWAPALGLLAVVLVGCAHAAARAGHPSLARAPLGHRGRFARHLGAAWRFGIVTAVVLGGAAWLAEASGRFGISVFGGELGGTRAELGGGVVPWAAALGLLAGSLAGFAGSLLSTARGPRAPR
ncbi:streptophobe family protein [Streptomyces hainanensis]|uniref:Integral membrane protein n=1 Tax=Streptomyces hainanensis TaxID=402648 RepID=A0A4V2Y2B2_9ACTN|nr:streptophobe family protein [Streptomyces hainanensis]TDC71975.1 hypothetical protein E1283_22775 [Streptomyces hainanensis]